MKRKLFWGLAVGLPLVLGTAWALLTPAGIIGSVAGVCIIGGVIIVMTGIGVGGGKDTAAKRLLPGANLEQMGGERRRTVEASPRWAGARRIGMGLAYVAAGAFLYWLK
jgi:hypothetical protein